MENKKLEKKELEQLTELINKSNGIAANIGVLETQKFNLLQSIMQTDVELQKLQTDLKEKYGDVNINIATGEIIEKESDEPNTQN